MFPKFSALMQSVKADIIIYLQYQNIQVGKSAVFEPTPVPHQKQILFKNCQLSFLFTKRIIKQFYIYF